ncbi:MAG TPA: cysteine desulfurase-like protein [Thermoanaerobaculia bacterium]|nr:cysteine desulfurase-like protein [Thermoanaerobaculia bacterium]
MPYTEEDNRRCRADFPSLDRQVASGPLTCFDGPAGTQVPRQVIDSMAQYYRTSNANTHGAFVTSIETDAIIHEARRAMADFVGAPDGGTISFGQNMTTLCYALSHAFGRLMRPGDEIVITQLDHEANRGPWIDLEDRGVIIREVLMTSEGALDYDDLARQVNPHTRIVAIGWASNALGTVNDIRLAREIASAAGAWLIVDAVHYAPHFAIDAGAIDCDALFCSVYKFYGPHLGALYMRPGLLDRLPTERLRSQEATGPERIEMGTLNHAALAGVIAAIDYRASWGEGSDRRSRLLAATAGIAAYERELARHYRDGLCAIRGVTVWGPDFATQRAPTISFTIDGLSPAEAAERLARRGFAVWNGDFFAPRPVEILGLDTSGGLIRAGISMYNTRAEVDALVRAIEEIVP